MKKLLLHCIAALCCFSMQAASAQPALSANDMALYQGADRHARLVEAAKKEGDLTVYHVYPNLPIVMAAFTKKYGIKVKPWRAGSEAVLQRVVSEARAGRSVVDVMQNNSPESEAAHQEKLLQEVRTPFHQDLHAAAVPAHKAWVGITLDIWTAAYNTNKVKKEDLPKTYQDLLDPKWKGQLGIEGDNLVWFGNLMGQLGEEQGLKLFNQIVAGNGISVRKGHSLLTMLVSSGEVPLALTVYSWNPEQLKAKGAPVEGHMLQPLIGQTSAISILKKSPNPNAALLFYEFMISEGQKLLAEANFIPSSKKIDTPFTNVPVKFIDPAQAIAMQAKWSKMYEETVTKKSK
jgi:iron(III) transport system substrate-binding protein